MSTADAAQPASNQHDPVTAAEAIDAGYNSWVAEAIEGRELTRYTLLNSNPEELFREVLEWHGIIGFSQSIVDAIDNLRNMEGEPV